MSDTAGEVARTYGLIVWKHMDAARKGNEPLRAKIFQMIETFEEVFPEECAEWNSRFTAEAVSVKEI